MATPNGIAATNSHGRLLPSRVRVASVSAPIAGSLTASKTRAAKSTAATLPTSTPTTSV